MYAIAQSGWFDLQTVSQLFDPQAIIFVAVALLMLVTAKYANDLVTPYKLDQELTTNDNKAIGVAFAAYLLGVTIILWGVLTSGSDISSNFSETKAFWIDLGSTAVWCLIGIGLLLVSRIVNDKLLLPKFNNNKELQEDKNVGTAAVIAGSYIGTALIVSVAVSGPGTGNFLIDILLTLAYFVVGQLSFILFGIIYQKLTSYDVHDEIEKDNPAVGISFGCSLIANSILISGYLEFFDSIPGLIVWFIISTFLLFSCRFIIDKVLLPGSAIDDEIQRDRNWGVALIEGFTIIGIALIIYGSFSS